MDCISHFQGDVIKFCGDAVIIMWPLAHSATDYETLMTIHKSAECSLSLVHECGTYTAQEGSNLVELKLHCGVGYGKANVYYVGTDERREFLISGKILKEVGQAESDAKQGQVVATQSAWSFLFDDYVGIELPNENVILMHAKSLSPQVIVSNELNPVLATRRLSSSMISCEASITPSDIKSSISHASSFFESHASYLRSYVHESARFALESTGNVQISEIRNVITLFVNIDLSNFDPDEIELDMMQNVLLMCMTSLCQFDACLRQFVIDDKGCVLIAAFGVPHFTHEDDCDRAIKTAFSIYSMLASSKYHLKTRIGISRGLAFCGLIGTSRRCEYAMMGSCVNLAARLMSIANPILVDSETHKQARRSFCFEMCDPIMAKGYSDPIPVYKPIQVKATLTPVRSRATSNDSQHSSNRKKGAEDLFVGRLEELDEIQKHLSSSNDTPLAILGCQGIGKAELIKRFIMMNRSIFSDVTIFDLSVDRDVAIKRILDNTMQIFMDEAEDKSRTTSFASDVTSVDCDNIVEQLKDITSLPKRKYPSIFCFLNLHEVTTNTFEEIVPFVEAAIAKRRKIVFSSQPSRLLTLLNCNVKSIWLSPLPLWDCFQLLKNFQSDIVNNMILAKELYLRCNGNPGEVIFLFENEFNRQPSTDKSQAKILSEFDSLPNNLQQLSKQSAVSDNGFDVDMLSAMLVNELKTNVKQVLRDGTSRRIFTTQDMTSYCFASAEVRSHVYFLMPSQQRRSLHMSLAKYYESSSLTDDLMEAAYQYLVCGQVDHFVGILSKLQLRLLQNLCFRKSLGVGLILFSFLMKQHFAYTDNQSWTACFDTLDRPRMISTTKMLLHHFCEVLDAQDIDIGTVCSCLIKGKYARPFWSCELTDLFSFEEESVKSKKFEIKQFLSRADDILIQNALIILLSCSIQLCHYNPNVFNMNDTSIVPSKRGRKVIIYSEYDSIYVEACDFLSLSTLEYQLSCCKWNKNNETCIGHCHKHDFLVWVKGILKGSKERQINTATSDCSCGGTNPYSNLRSMISELFSLNFDAVVSLSPLEPSNPEEIEIESVSMCLLAWANVMNGNLSISIKLVQAMTERKLKTDNACVISEGLFFNAMEDNLSLLSEFLKVLARVFALNDPSCSSSSHLTITVLLFLRQGLARESLTMIESFLRDADLTNFMPSMHFPVDLLCFGYACHVVMHVESESVDGKRANQILMSIVEISITYAKKYKQNFISTVFSEIANKLSGNDNDDSNNKLNPLWSLLCGNL